MKPLTPFWFDIALALIVALIAALVAAYSIPVAAAAPDVGDVKDGFTIAAVVVSQIFGAGAVWGAIRADIRNLHDKVASAHESAKEAHDRIDDIYKRYGERRK